MTESASYLEALSRLQELMAVAPQNRWYREVVNARDEVLARFGPVFHPAHVAQLQEAEFRAFLLFENNKHWSGLQRHGNRCCQDMDLLREGLIVLLDESRPIAERFDYATRNVPGMGKALATAILLVAYPDKYGVWNTASQHALESLRIWPSFPRGSSEGHQYQRINDLFVQLSRDLGIDLWTLDSLLWYAQTPENQGGVTEAPSPRSQATGVLTPGERHGARPGNQHTPAVWWVNQGKTFDHESAGGYFWAPLRDRRGGSPAHWRRMEEVRPGDIVLHYSDGFVRAVSRVREAPQRAPYPREAHGQYGGREGNLVYTHYHRLDPPVPRAVTAGLNNLPTTDGPFTSSGAVQQGYLYRFSVEAVRELIATFDTSWPRWLTDALAPLGFRRPPALGQFLAEIQNMRLATQNGQRFRYKPLMLLAAIRTMVEGHMVAFADGPLLSHYRGFAEAVGADPSRPEYPYFHLSNDGFWNIIVTASGQPFVSSGTPPRSALHGTHIEFAGERADCILDDELRPYVLGAVRTYFNDDEWQRLARIWPELAGATEPSGRLRTGRRADLPEAQPDLEAVTRSFAEALQQSHLRFDARFIRRFVASLATKPFGILTGLSGSGKTQLALQFGRWFGEDRVLLVAVRPDWTGSDALFGYEDALKPPAGDGRPAWHAPLPLRFMLEAARNPDWPYLLILDEMNLAHVERYFADVLSGMESGEPCLPNLAPETDDNGEAWRLMPGEPELIPFPDNLFIVGTVNVDETTYMFSPKVLDRANTLEFRVATEDLVDDLRKPEPCQPGPDPLVRGFLAVARDVDGHVGRPHPEKERLSRELRRLHGLLHASGFEFGHRVFTESLRFAAMLAAAGEPGLEAALDAIVMQKILPRLHGNRRRLEPVLAAVGAFAYYPDGAPADTGPVPAQFNVLQPPDVDGAPRLPVSFAKLQRMMANLQANQFTSFAE